MCLCVVGGDIADSVFCFFCNDTAYTVIYTSVHTLSLHVALPIFVVDYAFWNDSALNLVSEPAPTGTTENIGPDVIEGLLMTASLVIDGQGRATYAAEIGRAYV